MEEPVYTDINFHLIEHPLTGDIVRLTNLDCIRRSLKTLCVWEKWDSPFHPEIHSYINEQLFEPFSSLVISNLKDKIRWLITRYETRILIKNINVELLNSEDGYSITIEFLVKSILKEGSVSFALKKLR